MPCRQKKKRCNGKKPHCSACLSSGIESECVYQSSSVGGQFREATSLRKLKPAGSHNNIATTPSRRGSSAQRFFSGHARLLPSIRELMVSIATSPSFNMLTNIPPYPPRPTFYLNPFMRIPFLMPDDPRAFALSTVSLEDMNLTFRIIYLYHRYHLGGYITRAKYDALLRGDTSNAAIHPFFIYLAHALGSQLHQESTGIFSFLYVTVVYMQMAWEALASMREVDDPFTMVQVYQVLAAGFIYSR